VPVPDGLSKDAARQIAETGRVSNASESIATSGFASSSQNLWDSTNSLATLGKPATSSQKSSDSCVLADAILIIRNFIFF
jgi:hypothetical protein